MKSFRLTIRPGTDPDECKECQVVGCPHTVLKIHHADHRIVLLIDDGLGQLRYVAGERNRHIGHQHLVNVANVADGERETLDAGRQCGQHDCDDNGQVLVYCGKTTEC